MSAIAWLDHTEADRDRERIERLVRTLELTTDELSRVRVRLERTAHGVREVLDHHVA